MDASEYGGAPLIGLNRLVVKTHGSSQKLQRIIADVLNISEDKITPESTFVDDLKADSLDVFQIITEIEDQFEIQIPDDAAEHITTVGDAVSQIQAALAK